MLEQPHKRYVRSCGDTYVQIHVHTSSSHCNEMADNSSVCVSGDLRAYGTGSSNTVTLE